MSFTEIILKKHQQSVFLFNLMIEFPQNQQRAEKETGVSLLFSVIEQNIYFMMLGFKDTENTELSVTLQS